MNKQQSRFTPIDEKYPSCEDVYVEFFVYGSYEKAKQQFQGNFIEPDFVQHVGETFINKLNRKRIANRDLWVISTEKKISSKDARHHLDWLLSRLIKEKEAILKLQENYVMGVKCVWFAASTGGPVIWPEQMLMLSELNLELSFSLYEVDR